MRVVISAIVQVKKRQRPNAHLVEFWDNKHSWCPVARKHAPRTAPLQRKHAARSAVGGNAVARSMQGTRHHAQHSMPRGAGPRCVALQAASEGRCTRHVASCARHVASCAPRGVAGCLGRTSSISPRGARACACDSLCARTCAWNRHYQCHRQYSVAYNGGKWPLVLFRLLVRRSCRSFEKYHDQQLRKQPATRALIPVRPIGAAHSHMRARVGGCGTVDGPWVRPQYHGCVAARERARVCQFGEHSVRTADV